MIRRIKEWRGERGMRKSQHKGIRQNWKPWRTGRWRGYNNVGMGKEGKREDGRMKNNEK